MDKNKPLDQILYEAYCESTGWKSAVTGANLPQYEQCLPAVVAGWRAVADAAAKWAALENAPEEQGPRGQEGRWQIANADTQ